jgi:putative endonuclease
VEDAAYVYIPLCADGSYYVGKTQKGLEARIGEHNAGVFPGYTAHRRPVVLMWAQEFQRYDDACAAERRIKGWSRAKKEALIRGDWDGIQWLAKRPGARAASFEARPSGPRTSG